MAKRYTRINWQNAPSTATPISAENLNKMDKGIKDNDDAIGDLALLTTNNKTDLVSAINEQNNNLGSYGYPNPVIVTDLNAVPINVRSTVYIGWGAHPSKPNEHNFIMETYPLTGTGTALQILYDYDAIVTSDPLIYARQNHGTGGTNWEVK